MSINLQDGRKSTLIHNPGTMPMSSDQDLPRELTRDERVKLERDVSLVSEFSKLKLDREAKRNWDLFYKRNTTRFFKDRHWTTREFEELCCDATSNETTKRVLFEVGCGVGNLFYPLLEEGSQFFVHACDLSPRAVQFVKVRRSRKRQDSIQ